MRRIKHGLIAIVVGAAAVLSSTSGPAGADAEAVPVNYTCDIPAATGLGAGAVPDTAPLTGLTTTIADTPDPVAPGATVHYDLDAPFPDLTGALPDVGFPIGIVYVKSIDITQPIPTGLNLASVTASLSPTPTWASVSKVGSNLVTHVQSAYPTLNATNGRIKIDTSVTPTTIQIQETNGTWVDLNFIPSMDIDATVSGASGSTIQWHPSTMLAKLYYHYSIPFLININWNDANTPCTPDTPSQVVASTTVGTPGLSVTKTADETSVVGGDPIHFHVTATNTGNVPLTGVVVTDVAVPGCASSPGNLAVGAHVTIDCTKTTSIANVPQFSNTAGADSNETAAVTSNTVNVTVTSPALPAGVAGTVTDAGSAAGVPGAWVAVLRTSDFSLAAGAVANGSGAYSVVAPPGSYYLYVIDPSGNHTTQFFGAPTAVTLTPGNTASANPTMASTKGAVTGTVVADGSGSPVAGAWAIALSATTGAPETAAVANGSGQFALNGLSTGNHLIVYADPTGAHISEFYANSSDANGATHVPVTAGGSTVANDSMAAQTPTAGGAALTGTITEAGTATPLSGVLVMALRASNYRMAAAGVTNGSGQYNLNVEAGDYKLAFLDTTGLHDMEWHNNLTYSQIASAVSVTAPAATNAVLDPRNGSMAGTITDDPAGTPVPGAWVLAIGPSGIIGSVTAGNGTYTVAGLPAGTYRAAFVDPPGSRQLEYYDNSPTAAGATPFNIVAGAATTINAAIGH